MCIFYLVYNTCCILHYLQTKATKLLEIRSRLGQDQRANIIEYSDLRLHHTDLCPSDLEFDLVMKELMDTKQVVIQQDENKARVEKIYDS